MHCATIASRVGGVPDLIEDGVQGLLFTARDIAALAAHMQTMACDEAARLRMQEALYEKAKRQFSVEATVARQREIYEKILRLTARRQQGRDGVLICGAYGRGNAGDDAILLAILTELRSIDPDLSFQVFSRNPMETRQTYRVNAFYTFHIWKAIYYFKRAKFFINGGGSLMQDVTSYRSLWFYLWTLATAKHYGCPVIMYGCGIGPIRNNGNRARAARVMNRSVDSITLRDPDSLKELEVLGVTEPKIALSADTTVSLPPASPDIIDGILDSRGIPANGNYIGFILRPWPGFEEKTKDIAAAADYVYETYGLTPVFFPIEPRLDVAAAQRVIHWMNAPHYILTEAYTAAQTIGILSRMKVVTSMRLHGLIFAAGQGVPLVGIVYDQKVSSFLSYIGQDLYEDLNRLTADKLKALIDGAVSRGKNPALLSESVEKLRRMDEVNRKVLEEYAAQKKNPAE